MSFERTAKHVDDAKVMTFWTTETCVKTSVHIIHGVAVEKVLELNRSSLIKS